MNRIVSNMDVGESEVLGAVKKLQEARKDAERKIRDLTERLLVYEADELSAQIQLVSDIPLLTKIFTDRDAEAIRLLAQQLISRHHCVALLGGGVGKMQLVFARSEELRQPMGTLMQNTMKQIGGRGGGRPEIAMGGAPDLETVKQAIAWAKEEIVKNSV